MFQSEGLFSCGHCPWVTARRSIGKVFVSTGVILLGVYYCLGFLANSYTLEQKSIML